MENIMLACAGMRDKLMVLNYEGLIVFRTAVRKMGFLREQLRIASLLASVLSLVHGQNSTDAVAGPPWHHSDFTSSPSVYPSRASKIGYYIAYPYD
jgi:hypothetical protein